MWRTSSGERTLEGAEAKVFAEVLWDFLDEINLGPDDDYILGVNVFDRLTYGQKISALSIVGKGLLTDVSPVPLTAVLEGAVAAIYHHLKNCIMIEIDEPEIGTNWRKKVVSARKECGGEEIPSHDCTDINEWDIEVDCLEDYILWDADYEDEDSFVDDLPEKADMMKETMGVSKDYYLENMDDLNEEEIEAKLKELRELCRSIVEESMA